jgi:hypothetical protein
VDYKIRTIPIRLDNGQVLNFDCFFKLKNNNHNIFELILFSFFAGFLVSGLISFIKN